LNLVTWRKGNMLVYRIALAKYPAALVASGRAARWNPNDVKMIYTASSRSLACLENAVHRSQAGLSQLFNVLIIDIPDSLPIKSIGIGELAEDWAAFSNMSITQRMGENWIREKQSAVLSVPSSIIGEEMNYLLNPAHDDFKLIRVVKVQPFVFDNRIKDYK
jgi:RES domain-containing protein